MKIAEIYSHLNGLEYLLVHKKKLWEELKTVVSSVDAEKCKTKKSKEKTKIGKTLYSPIDMNEEFKKLLGQKNWKESRVNYWITKNEKLIRKTLIMDQKDQKREIEATGEMPIMSYNQTDFVKDRVAVEVQFGKYAFVAYDLFVKHLAFYVGDTIDVGIKNYSFFELNNLYTFFWILCLPHFGAFQEMSGYFNFLCFLANQATAIRFGPQLTALASQMIN